MTANVRLVVAEKPSVLKVSNAALRFRPAGAEPGPGGDGGAGGSRGGTGATRRSADSAGGGSGGGGGGGDAGAGRPSLSEIRERLVKSLDLTEEQQRRLDPILEESRQQMIALRGEHLPDWQMRWRAQQIRERSRARIREILTTEQRERYDQMARPARGGEGRAATPGRVFVVGPDGKPTAVSVMLGLTDGASTEIVKGELAEGQEVIVGTIGAGTQPRPSSQSQQGPRLRL
jgi:HlyD family secretion protein